MQSVNRENFKHFLLKKIIFRIDYRGLLDSDIENYVANVREELRTFGFIDYFTRIEDADEMLRMSPTFEQEKQDYCSEQCSGPSRLYTFKSENRMNEVVIRSNYLMMKIKVNEDYSGFSIYEELLIRLINELKNTSSFFKSVRIGLRKQNLCYFTSLEKIKKCFARGTFEADNAIFGESFDYKSSNMFTLFKKDNYKINYIRNIQEGMLSDNEGVDRKGYQAVLDIDVYCDDLNVLSQLLSGNTNEMLDTQNEIAFELYSKSLSEEFARQLMNDSIEDEEIIGV